MAHAAADLLVRLLRMSIRNEIDEPAYWQGITDEAWQAGYLLSIRHNVTALAWQGVILLPAELQPDIDLKVNWLLAAERWQQKYAYHCSVVAELSAFLAKHGIGTVVLKGVGLSTYYPTPSYREGNDIDIYTFSLDRNQMTDEEANRKTDDLMIQEGINVNAENKKHSSFIYKKIPVENHHTFLNVEYIKNARSIENLLHKYLNPTFVTLLHGKYQIRVPSATFNTLFLPFHAAQHSVQGVSLHHLYDWSVFLRKEGLHLPTDLKDEKFKQYIFTLTDISNHYLGTNIPTTRNQVIESILIENLFHRKYDIQEIPKNRIYALIWKMKRFKYDLSKKSILLDVSIKNIIWIRLKYIIKHPKNFFKE